MTVQELINKLNSLTNKELEVCFSNDHETEKDKLISIKGVFDVGTCIMLSDSNICICGPQELWSDSAKQAYYIGYQEGEKRERQRHIDAKTILYFKTINKQIGDNFQPSLPRCSPSVYTEIVIPIMHKFGAIPKSQLKEGVSYKGYCRNAGEAVWLGDKFEYQRYKFGDTFPEKINHFEDDNGYDLFVPYQELTN